MAAKRKEDAGAVEPASAREFKSNYKPEDFIIPSKDTRGESIRVWNRIQPGHDRQISTITQAKLFPFRTPGDVMRWCIHDGLKRLVAMERGIPSVMQQVDAICAMLRDEEANLDFQVVIHQLQTVVQRHMAEGSVAEAKRIAIEVKQQIDAMPHGFWREKYQKQFKETYGHLLARKTKVRMTRFEEDEDDE